MLPLELAGLVSKAVPFLAVCLPLGTKKWYRPGGAHGGMSPASLRSRVGFPAKPPPETCRDLAAQRGAYSVRPGTADIPPGLFVQTPAVVGHLNPLIPS
eukprot:SAG22_NODE_723_length_7636_cov_75.271726_5_plen_99_part_00